MFCPPFAFFLQDPFFLKVFLEMMKPHGGVPLKLPHQATSFTAKSIDNYASKQLKINPQNSVFLSKISYSTQKYHFSKKSGIFYSHQVFISLSAF
jgi:hypothetical protein